MTSRISRSRKVTLVIAGQAVQLDAPGLKAIKRGKTQDLYWAKSEADEFKFYPTKTVRIHVDLSSVDTCDFDLIETICQREQQAMLTWADGNVSDATRLAHQYNGTIGSLATLYRSDAESAFQYIKANSKESYEAELKVVVETIGARRLDHLSPKAFRAYYDRWKAPAQEGGEERVRRAHGCITMVRGILSYGVEADIPDCERLRKGLSQMRFAKNPPRDDTMTYAQAEAIVDECLKHGDVHMGLTQALQYECFLRQGDIRGEWRPEPKSYALKSGEVRNGGNVWSGLTINQVQLDKALVLRTSKTSQPVVHALDKCPLVVRCVEALDRTDPFKPVAARPDGEPWGDRQACE